MVLDSLSVWVLQHFQYGFATIKYKYCKMKKIQDKNYVILLAICVVIMAIVVALTKSKETAIAVLLTGVGAVVGLTIGVLARRKSAVGKAVDEMDPKARRQLTVFLMLGAALTMTAIVLLVLYLK